MNHVERVEEGYHYQVLERLYQARRAWCDQWAFGGLDAAGFLVSPQWYAALQAGGCPYTLTAEGEGARAKLFGLPIHPSKALPEGEFIVLTMDMVDGGNL